MGTDRAAADRGAGSEAGGRGAQKDPKKVALLIPALNRPQNVEPLVRSALDNTPDCRVVFICDWKDAVTHKAARAANADVYGHSGRYSEKINRAVRYVTEPYVFLGADDLRFHPGWFEAAEAKMVGPVQVVGTNDLGNPRVVAGQHSTHFLVKTRYADEGTIDGEPGLLHEGYIHNFVDDEFLGTATKRGVYAMALDSIVEHLHPDWGKAPDDEVYAIGKRTFEQDRLHWRHRHLLWS